MINLYTLPTCGICQLIKKKLIAKNIKYNEYSLEDYITILNTDRAPVLQVGEQLFTSPTDINNWINEQ